MTKYSKMNEGEKVVAVLTNYQSLQSRGLLKALIEIETYQKEKEEILNFFFI